MANADKAVKTPSKSTTGWRTLELVYVDESDFRLTSYEGPKWPTDRPLIAECRAGRSHVALSDDCLSGIYARLAMEDFIGPRRLRWSLGS